MQIKHIKAIHSRYAIYNAADSLNSVNTVRLRIRANSRTVRDMQCTMNSNRAGHVEVPLKIMSAFEQATCYIHARVLCTILMDLFKLRFTVSG